MRVLVFNRNTPSVVPIPYYVGGGIEENLLSFLVARNAYPDQIKSELKDVGASRLDDIAGHISFLINIFEQEGISYLEATYETLSQVIKSLYEDEEWKGSSLIIYAGSWRLFYTYLTKINVSHNMVMPKKLKVSSKARKDDQFLSHTPGSINYYDNDRETMVPTEYLIFTDDYREKVISMDQWFELYSYLYEEDPVYAIMAATMLQTFLRIGGVFQFPMAPTKQNPKWKRYAQFKSGSKSFQELNYIKKGQRRAKCLVHLCTMELIENEYMTPFYEERRSLYENKYVKSKHARNKVRTVKDKFLWLNKNGTPVSKKELQAVFIKASEALGFDVTAHSMRHTGATQLLWLYSKQHNVVLDVNQSSSIHVWLKKQLGHASIETTEHYIRTVNRLESEDVIAEMLPTALPTSIEKMNLPDEYLVIMKRAIKQNEIFFRGIDYDEAA